MAAKGREKHQARLDAVQAFGKDLARRARSKCELCDSGDEVRIHNTDPEGTPSMDTLLMLCGRCRAVLDDGRKEDERTMRFLESAVWNEVPVVAAVAKQMLEGVDAAWAREALANL